MTRSETAVQVERKGCSSGSPGYLVAINEEVGGMRKAAVVMLAVAVGLALAVGAAGAKEKQTLKGTVALEHAAKAKKYLYIFFYSDDSEQTASIRGTFNGAVDKVSRKAERVEVNVTDPAETALIDKYNVRGAPMPLVLVIAPNGAITGGFSAPFEEKQLLSAMVTPCTQASLKALQEGKKVVLCVQNRTTRENDAAMKGVQEFKADPAYGSSAEIITVDPSDPLEATLMGTLAIDPKTDQAMTVCLVPPGQRTAKLIGVTTKEMIASSFKSGGGCAPGACGGAKSCGPTTGGQAAGQPGAAAPSGCSPGTKTAGK
jgi:hypothetical protein